MSLNMSQDVVLLTFLLRSLLFALAFLSAFSVPWSRPPRSVLVILPKILDFIPVPLPLRTSPLSPLHRPFPLCPLVSHGCRSSIALSFSLLFFVVCRWEWGMGGRAGWGSWGMRVMTFTCTVTGDDTFMEVQLETEQNTTKWEWWKVWLSYEKMRITKWRQERQRKQQKQIEANCSNLVLLAKIHTQYFGIACGPFHTMQCFSSGHSFLYSGVLRENMTDWGLKKTTKRHQVAQYNITHELWDITRIKNTE